VALRVRQVAQTFFVRDALALQIRRLIGWRCRARIVPLAARAVRGKLFLLRALGTLGGFGLGAFALQALAILVVKPGPVCLDHHRRVYLTPYAEIAGDKFTAVARWLRIQLIERFFLRTVALDAGVDAGMAVGKPRHPRRQHLRDGLRE